ncbi:uncharacterized protein CDAR_304881 [Caerostris darwini]|uniref:Uncharacterized protein n=1 Tax=Caerostris darwini TaxID=1538125 RepID=A0AAV4Q248_9ARAC|nr:uncharacterized protein CDAR_304881 [Caerostris darwini]
MGFFWTCSTHKSTRTTHIDIQAPTIHRDCTSQSIPCVDDCSFLCVESKVKCVGGTCVVQENNDIECQADKGGMRILVKDPVSHWTCLCTDATFFSGPDCGQLNPDVCENGVFFYTSKVCLCPQPYQLVKLNGKPHCIEAKVANFFKNQDLEESAQGPSPAQII